MKQLTIFDVLPGEEQASEVPYGYIKDMRIVGKELSFQDLKNYIGKQVVKCVSTESNQYFRVYKVIEYYENCFTYYKQVRPLPDNPIGYGEYVNEYIHDVVGIKECMACYEPAFTCDRVGLSDNGKDKENSVVCEAYCSNGRYDEILDYTGEVESFYEIVALM